MKIQWLLPTLITLLATLVSAAEIPFDQPTNTFIQNYCTSCHGADKQKGDRAFHEIGKVIDLSKEENLFLLEDILDQLNLGEMPPKKNGVKQPPQNEISQVTKWITDTLLSHEEGTRKNHTVLRRLNRREYRNTIEDLLGLRGLTEDPTSEFPADDIEEGFTNIGEALNLSESHLDQYLKAADNYLDKAIYIGPTKEAKTISIKPHEWGAPAKEATTPWVYRLHKPGQYLDIGAGMKDLTAKTYMITYPSSLRNTNGIREPGFYRIKVNATAVRRLTHGYDPEMIPTNLDSPIQLGVYVANTREGLSAAGADYRTRVGLWDLKDHKAEDYQVTVWLNKGAIPFVNWDNGPGPSDYWMRDILKQYHTDIEFRGKEGAHAWHIIGKNAVPGRVVSDVWHGPVMRIREFSFTGPLPETYHTETNKRYFGGIKGIGRPRLEKALQTFTSAAFRRPTSLAEVAPYASIFDQAIKADRPRQRALQLAMKAVLVSPDFLYLKETGTADGSLTAHELANRLSYFLWSTMPDKTLSKLADSGQIDQPSALEAQAKRMLASPKTAALIDGLCDSWLRLDKLGAMPPDNNKFGEYYLYNYESLFRDETHHFLRYILKENRPISDFLKSNYTFVNQDLARHYKIDGVEGLPFRKVALKPSHRRGGLLGQASIQTLTANGVDTTPVTRGVWILENILGTPPPPPPPDIEPLDADTRGAKNIRQRLAKHRTVETCADCHNKIDPYGFPFEFYDPIGGYRETYFRNRYWHFEKRKTIFAPGQKINGWAKLESGKTIDNLADLQKVLLTKQPQFKRAVVEKLMIYATGRKMTFRDHQAIEAIVKSDQNGFQDLVLAVIKSPIFTRK